jgi:hypothetical protein
MHPAQRRHPPRRLRNPTTPPAEGSGAPARFPSGEREGQRPADRRDSRCRGGVIRHDDVPTPAHGRPRGAAPTNRGRPYMITCSGGMHPNRMNCRPHHLRRGLGRRGDEATSDEPDAGVPCSYALPTVLFPVAPMHPAQRRHPPRRLRNPTTSPAEGEQGDEATRRRSDEARRREDGHGQPTAHALLSSCTHRNGGMRPNRTPCRPPHLRRGRGEPSGFPRGEREGQRPLDL